MKFQTTHKEKKKNKNKEFDGKYRICRDEKEIVASVGGR
jgi:hypothetical protein